MNEREQMNTLFDNNIVDRFLDGDLPRTEPPLVRAFQ